MKFEVVCHVTFIPLNFDARCGGKSETPNPKSETIPKSEEKKAKLLQNTSCLSFLPLNLDIVSDFDIRISNLQRQCMVRSRDSLQWKSLLAIDQWMNRVTMYVRTIVFVTMLLGVAGCYTGSTPPPIVIGHVSDKTRLDKAGDQVELGLRLALHDLNKDGTLAESFGGREIQIRHTDTQGQLDAFESQAVRLDSINKSLALFGGHSAAEATALNNAKIPLLTMFGQKVSGVGNQVFYLGMSPNRQGVILAKFVAEDAKAISVVLLLDERRPESATFAETFQNTLVETRKQNNGKEAKILLLRFGKDAKWGELSERIEGQTPHSVVFAGAANDFNAWHKEYRRMYPPSPTQMVYAGNDGEQRLFDLEGNSKEAIVLATAFHADPASEKITAFAKAFHEAFKTDADVNAAIAYDGFRIMVEAMKRTSTQLISEKLRDELVKTKDFEGLTGLLTINADRQVQRPLFLLRWQNGATTLLKTVAP
jgi:branched-chain amino acid transport system substrate-binding protein